MPVLPRKNPVDNRNPIRVPATKVDEHQKADKHFGAIEDHGVVATAPTPLPDDNKFHIWTISDTVYGYVNGVTEILWPNSRLLDSDSLAVNVESTTTETAIYSGTVAANIMGTEGGVELNVFGDMLKNAAGTLTWKVKLGATTVLTSNARTWDSIATERYKWALRVMVVNAGATNSQKVGATFLLDQAGTSITFPMNRQSDAPALNGQGTGYGTAAEDSTAALAFVVTVQWSASSASLSLRKELALLERIGGTASAGGGGVAAHALLDGGTAHSDSAADGVTRGSLIYGNATPAWDELVIGAANTYLKSDGTDVAWATIPSGGGSPGPPGEDGEPGPMGPPGPAAPFATMISIELTNLAQGSDKVLFTFPKGSSAYYTLAISAQATPTVQHSFTFMKNGSIISAGAAVTMTTSGTLWTTSLAAFSFAPGDVFSVRHDTNAQDSDESSSHTDEGGRIQAHIY